MLEAHQNWETGMAEYRLTQRHALELAKTEARRKKRKWMRASAERLKKEIAKWHYRKQVMPDDLEVGWIIHSHLAWKGPETTAEALWEDLPETDPANILEAEKAGRDSDSAVPGDVLLLLM